MNGIQVPAHLKHMVKRERNSREYNEATIRDYVKANEGKVISGQMFTDALDGLSTAPTIVRRLVKQGKLKRRQVYTGQKGTAYTYTWVSGGTVLPLKTKETNGEVITKPRGVYATDHELRRLNEWFIDYCNEAKTGGTLISVNHFRQFVVNKTKGEVDETSKTEI